MNILYLIGNGFDLNLGLQTKLSHVASKILEKETDNQDILQLKDNLLKNRDLWWSDFELELGKYTDGFTTETIASYKNQYNYIIKKIINLFERQEERIDYKENSSTIAASFMKYLTSFYNYLPDTKKQYILDKMSFIGLNENIFYNFISFNYTNVLDNFINCSVQEYSKTHFSTCIPTRTPRYVKHFLQKIIHIHSTLNEGLILGVDNTEQITNKQLAENNTFTPRIVKLETIEALGRNSAIEARTLIDSSNIIITFGLSIGLTDKYWWNYIINWLNKNIERQFILFIYDDKMDSTLNQTKLNTMLNADNKLFSVLDNKLQAEYKACKNRIHFIIEPKDMFKIDNIFYPPKNDMLNNYEGSYNRFKNIEAVSKVIQNITPEAINNITNFMKKCPCL